MEFERNTRKRKSIILSLFIFILLIAFGITPQTSAVLLLAILAAIFYMILEKKVTQRRTLLDDAIQRLEVDKAIRDYRDVGESEYVFPLKCPSCNARLQLNEVQWIDSRSAVCPNCESIVHASTQE